MTVVYFISLILVQNVCTDGGSGSMDVPKQKQSSDTSTADEGYHILLQYVYCVYFIVNL